MTTEPSPLQVLLLNWRDVRNPEGGGSERYVERVAAGLAAAGHSVTVFCAAHQDAPPDEHRDGIRYVRRGNRLTVYPRALLALATRRLGRPDVVVDTQNGFPFFARVATRRPVVVLVHHVHREQWPVVFGPRLARFGWWVESRLAPRVFRGCQYVAVSESTRRELAGLGVDRRNIAVVHNGTEPVAHLALPRGASPEVVVLGRLVPHKRVDHALEAVATLRAEIPALRITVVGDGWWSGQLRADAARLGLTGAVEFTGHVDEAVKHRHLARAWAMALPSLKEGWGLAVLEAAAHGVPTVAYRSAGGVTESVVDGVSGILVDDSVDAMAAALRTLLTDDAVRTAMSQGAREHAVGFTWAETTASFERVLRDVLAGQRHGDSDPAVDASDGQLLP
jgi:glycosyltransferase involved in cell wall biosynthesis